MTGKVAYTPSDWAKNGDPYDCTGFIGPLYPNDDINDPPEWPMYSFDTPAYILWNAIAGELYKRGWNDEQIKDWLQSKNPRWALDQDLGDAIRKLGKTYAQTIVEENAK